MSNQIRLKRGSGSNPSASDLVVGEVALRTDNGKLFTKKDDNSITEIGSGISDGDKGDITISNSGGTFTIDNGAVTSAKILDGTIVGSDLATNIDLVDNQKLRLGTGNDLQIYHDGTDSFIDNSSGSLKIQGVGSNGFDVHIQARSDEEGIKLLNNSGESKVELYYDNNKKFETTSTGINVTNDITNTSGSDLVINSTGRVQLQVANGEKAVYCDNNGAVELYFNNSKKFETTNAGVAVSGVLTTSSYISIGGSQHLYLEDNGKAIFGAGSDLQIYHSGTQSYVTDQGTGNLNLQGTSKVVIGNAAHDENMAQFFADGQVELYYDNSKKFETTSLGTKIIGDLWLDNPDNAGKDIQFDSSANKMKFDDNVKANFGSGDDLEIYHNGSNSYIDDTGTGSLFIRSNEVRINKYTNEFMIKAIADGAVELYHDNSKKLNTESFGVDITGTLRADELKLAADNQKLKIGAGQDLELYHDGTRSFIDNATGELRIRSQFIALQPEGGGEQMAFGTQGGSFELYYDGVKKFETTSTGITVTGSINSSGGFIDGDLFMDGATAGRDIVFDRSENALEFRDNAKALFGTGDDLQIYHDGGHSYIHQDGTGTLRVLADNFRLNNEADSENIIKADANGAVELYYDNSKKLETATDRVSIYGNLSIADGSGFIMQNGFTNASVLMRNAGGSTDGNFEFLTRTGGGSLVEALEITKDSHIRIVNDSKQLRLGAGDDFRLEHDGSHSYISNYTGNLYFRTVSNETSAIFKPNGAVELYHDNSKKFNTLADGVHVHGQIQLNDNGKLNIGDSDDLKIYHDGTNSVIAAANTGDLQIFAQADDILLQAVDNIFIKPQNGESGLNVLGNGAVELFYDNSKKFETTSGGAKVTGFLNVTTGIHIPDGGDNDNSITMGSSNELRLFHDGSNSFIKDTAGSTFSITATESIAIKTNDTEFAIACNKNGGVELYHDGSKKFETTSKGILVEGGQANGELGRFFATGSTFQSTTLQAVASRNTTNNTYAHFKCSINGVADKLFIRDSGNVQNTNNSYSSISDVNLKENIVDAGSQWDDIKNIRVRKFNFKEATDPTKTTMLGVVAQEAELVCPNLVESDVSLQEGVEKEYKSFKYSILYMKAIKCLQEAMAKIEVLETEVAALKAG